jgi:hypothetical protein
MKKKIQEAQERIRQSKEMSEEEKSAILEKIEEWKKEDAAIGDLMTHLQEWWIKVEPIFAELGLV